MVTWSQERSRFRSLHSGLPGPFTQVPDCPGSLIGAPCVHAEDSAGAERSSAEGAADHAWRLRPSVPERWCCVCTDPGAETTAGAPGAGPTHGRLAWYSGEAGLRRLGSLFLQQGRFSHHWGILESQGHQNEIIRCQILLTVCLQSFFKHLKVHFSFQIIKCCG